MYIIRHFIFKRKHSGYIEISGSGNQIFPVCIFTSKLIPQKMAAIIKIFSIYIVIFYGMPSGRFNHSDRTTFFCRHQFRSDFGLRISTSAKGIQLTVKFISPSILFFGRKIRNISINFYIRTAAVFRNISRRNSLLLFFVCFPFWFSVSRTVSEIVSDMFSEKFFAFSSIYVRKTVPNSSPCFFASSRVCGGTSSITQSNCNTKYNCGYHIFYRLSFSFSLFPVCGISFLFQSVPLLFPLTDIICTVKSIITFRFSKRQPYIRFLFFL